MSQMAGSQTRGFLFADLRDYTRFAEAHGDHAAAELLARYRSLVRDVITRFDGAEIRTEGDSFYIVFSSASAAVNGGLAIIEAAAAATAPGGGGVIRVGVGVHAGETAETPEGLVGSAVNLAARICAVAGPGELLVSDTVRGLTRTFLPVQFGSRGRQRLKGMAEPVAVYRVLRGSGAARDEAARTRRPGSPVLLAVAVVLPLLSVVTAVLLGAMSGIGPFGGLHGASNPGPTSDATALSSPVPATSGLETAEAELVARLPAAIGEACVSASVAEGSAGGAVSIRCEPPLSGGADEIWVDQFPSPETLGSAISGEISRTRAPAGDCATASLAYGAWDVPNVRSGKVLCYQEGGAAWLAWTYDAERIIVRARRSDRDWQALYAWWRETAIFLR